MWVEEAGYLHIRVFDQTHTIFISTIDQLRFISETIEIWKYETEFWRYCQPPVSPYYHKNVYFVLLDFEFVSLTVLIKQLSMDYCKLYAKTFSGFIDQLWSVTWYTTYPDLSWWRHQMETFSALLDLCDGNSPVTGEIPSQRPVTRSFDVFFDIRLNKRLSKQPRRRWFETPSHSLWRHCNVGPRVKIIEIRITEQALSLKIVSCAK